MGRFRGTGGLRNDRCPNRTCRRRRDPVWHHRTHVGAAASWGIGADWVGQQAVKWINEHGGITAGGKTYKVALTTYENGYNSADGGKAAQAMLNRDHVRFIIQGIGTAPVKALQSLSERVGALMMQDAWGKSVKGPQAPLTFTCANTPFELFGPLFDLVKRQHPEAKTVALLNPNDATGQEVEVEAVKRYKARGYTIVLSAWYERGTTEFQPIATKLAQSQADIMDLSGAPPADAGSVYKELAVQGWKGVKVVSSGTGSDALVKVGGAAVEDVYMGNAADFGGPTATPLQRRARCGRAEGVGRAGEHPAHGRLGFGDGDQGRNREGQFNRPQGGGQGAAHADLEFKLRPGGVRRRGNLRQSTADAGADHRHADQARPDRGDRADRPG